MLEIAGNLHIVSLPRSWNSASWKHDHLEQQYFPEFPYILHSLHLDCAFYQKMFAAEFTTEYSKPCECSRCKQVFPAGTKLHYMQDARYPNKAGRSLCDSCHDYYLSKPSTRRVEEGKEFMFAILNSILDTIHWNLYISGPSQSTSHGGGYRQPNRGSAESAHRRQVHDQVAAAQRGGKSIITNIVSSSEWIATYLKSFILYRIISTAGSGYWWHKPKIHAQETLANKVFIYSRSISDPSTGNRPLCCHAGSLRPLWTYTYFL